MKQKNNSIKIEADQILLQSREIFLTEAIDEKASAKIVKELLALDKLNHKSITLWINSPGGTVHGGLAIVDIIKKISSPITTIIIGKACSIAGIISLVGKKRLMTANSVWMAHDMSGGVGSDYTSKVLSRTKFLKQYRELLLQILINKTKLTKLDLTKALNGELWLFPEECKIKGIVDKIIN